MAPANPPLDPFLSNSTAMPTTTYGEVAARAPLFHSKEVATRSPISQ